MTYKLPSQVIECLKILKNNNIEAYLVGGCVRDMLLGIEPDDYDIAVNASPDKIMSLFEHTIATGIKHGTVTIVINSMPIEITQMRIDGVYNDNRRPESVTPTSCIYDDLKRRDFTINAIAMNLDYEIIDKFGGKNDLSEKIIRTVGNPHDRYSEDALRIIRAFRFASKLDFNIEKDTEQYAIEQSYTLQNISVERIFTELIKTIMGQNPAKIEPLIKSGGLEFIGLSYNKSLECINKLPHNREIRFATLLYLCNADSNFVCNKLKCDNLLKKQTSWYLKMLKSNLLTTRYGIKRLIGDADFAMVEMLIKGYEIINNTSLHNSILMLESINLNHEPIFLKDLTLNGNDLLNIGVSGKNISTTLEFLLDTVRKDASLNEKNKLLQLLKDFKTDKSV